MDNHGRYDIDDPSLTWSDSQKRLLSTVKGLATRNKHRIRWTYFPASGIVSGQCKNHGCEGRSLVVDMDDLTYDGEAVNEKCSGIQNKDWTGWMDRELSRKTATKEWADRLWEWFEQARDADLSIQEAMGLAAYMKARTLLDNNETTIYGKTARKYFPDEQFDDDEIVWLNEGDRLLRKYAATGTFRKYMPKSVDAFIRWTS